MAALSDLRKSRLAKRDDYRSDRLNVVVASAEAALKSAFLVNGGGAVALLAFFGQLWGQVLPYAQALRLSAKIKSPLRGFLFWETGSRIICCSPHE
jgi:hypothetical protein